MEKLVLAAILAGSMAIGNSAFAATLEDEFDFSKRGVATLETYKFDGKGFVHARFYTEGSITSKDDGVITELRPLLDGEDKAIDKSLNYWYGVLGTPATVPYIDIYLGQPKDFSAAAGSNPAGEVTKLAKCFQEKINNDPDSYDAVIFVNQPEVNKNFYMDKLSILPTNGADMHYSSTLVHEMFHALGIATSFQAKFDDENKPIDLKTSTFTRYEQSLYDFRGTKLVDCNKLAIIESPEEDTDPKTFYFIKKSDTTSSNEGFNGVYFKGKHVDEVLNLNGKQALIAFPDNHDLDPVAGIPINGVETAGGEPPFNVELSHFELQNSMQSHQSYRNWGVPMEVELAALEDLGYTIDRRKLYGNSIYNSGIEYVNNNPFYERKDGKYLDGERSTQSLAIGLHVYGSDNKILQKSNLLADGAESMGIRVDGVNNKLTIDKDSKVTANGINGRGVNFAYGKNHELNVEGTVTALGDGGRALAFDFGDNMLRNGDEYRGSYIRVSVENDAVTDMFDDPDTPKLSALDGALVKEVNISGTVAGKEAAIYISPNAYVQNINIKTGSVLEGAILSDWSPTGIPGIMGPDGADGKLDLSPSYIHLPAEDDGLTRLNFVGDNLSYKGNIGSSMFAYGSFVMNVNSGTLNYEGTAKVDSVNVAKDAILQGGTFDLDKMGSNIRDDISKDNSGTLTNKGMISAALPVNGNTVLSIEGNVKNEGGAFGFIANDDKVGTIEIIGSLSEDSNKTLAVNPNGSYLPGSTYNVSSFVTIKEDAEGEGTAVVFEDALPYNTAMLKAVYGDDFGENYTSISFVTDNNLQTNDAVVNSAFVEMDNLAQAVGESSNQKGKENLARLYSLESNKAAKALKAIKGNETANTSVVMQQSNLVRNTLGMRLSQVNRAKMVNVRVPVAQLDETKEPLAQVEMPIELKPEYSMWAKINRNKGAINSQSDYKTDAYSIGWDKQVSKDWRFGFFGSYAKGKFEADTIYNSLEDYRLGVYGGYNKGPAEAMVYADYGWGKNKLSRSLTGLAQNTNAKYNSNVMEIGAEYKYDLLHKNNKTWHVAPYGSLQLNRYSQNSYTETGADPFNQDVDKLNNTYAGFEAGVDLERRFANGSAYGMRLGYRRGLTGVDPKQNYHYAADPAHRYTNYGETDKNKLVFSLNGEVQTAPNWSVSAETGYERGKKGHGYSGEITLKYTW